MRLYGNRFIKKSLKDHADTRIETRDAIVWSVDNDLRIASVKIQGSNQLIRAYYPENWEQTPSWLKPGNAVRITHTGGNRGRIELVGHGQFVPTPLSGAAGPTLPTGEDAIITGLPVVQIPYGDWMRVMVNIGTVRFSGTTYTRDAISMAEGDYFTMAMGGFMNEVAGVLPIDTAPAAGSSRYDLIAIGSDLLFDVVKGTASSNPVMPDVPSGHLKCGHVLLYAGMTKIVQSDINKYFSEPVPTILSMTIADEDLAWAELSTTVTIAIKDQYGNPIYIAAPGWGMTLAITAGNGKVSIGSQESTSSISEHTGASSNQIVFTYTRDQLDPGDVSPTLVATIDGYPLSVTKRILLRDIDGNPM